MTKHTIEERTSRYEQWAGSVTTLVPEDLEQKHDEMAQSAFSFLRATFYRWADHWQETCSDLAAVPRVLGVGDLHVENYGTWRDAEGRLIWGINDFDEAHRLAYAADLVRLAASALLANKDGLLRLDPREASAAIIEGYDEMLQKGGRAFVLEEEHEALRAMALAERDPVKFWAKMNALPDIEAQPAVRETLARHLPDRDLPFRIVKRVSGLGSLGRQRYVALAIWRAGMIAREAKAVLPSAYAWAAGEKAEAGAYLRLANGPARCPDPFVAVDGPWQIRRLGPRCSRIELKSLKARDERRLLKAMGSEAANVHFGTPEAIPALKADLKRRKNGWLFKAAEKMAQRILDDWKDWRDSHQAAQKRSK